ncbi:MAG: Uma2 family endonuclease [Rivularia sp. (in: cyanobacteria)]
MQITQQRYYSTEEYLELEETAENKSEYIDGEIIPMAGASTNHNRIAGNLYSAVNFAFRRENYEAFISDVRLWIPKRRIYFYPDIMIVTGEAEYYDNRTDTILNPQVIIEVLSKSTKGYDKEGKFEIYRTIESFQEYLLIDQTKIRVEQYFKTGKKQWVLREYDEEDENITFNSIPFEISLEDLYNRVKFEVVDSDSDGK